MRKIFFLLLIAISYLTKAQEKPIVISGNVLYNKTTLADVHIINETLEIGTITDDDGSFKILANKGDLLLISHINFEENQYYITDKDIHNKDLIIQLTHKTYVLNEVFIESKKGIFHIDKDIMPHNAPIVNAKTLDLPYAESEKVKEEKLLKIRSGASVNLDGILNILNGTHKKEKELKEIQLEDDNLLAIRNHFSDSFFTNQLHIKKEHINIFLNYNISSGIIHLHKKAKFLQLTTILLNNSKSFSHNNLEEKTKISLK